MSNDFTPASAAWLFEPGALAVDSLGKVPDLYLFNTPTSDAVNFMEGTGSAKLGDAFTNRHFWITDALLPTGFPLRSDGTRIFSTVGWYRTNTDDGNYAPVFSKYHWISDPTQNSFGFKLGNATTDGEVLWWYGGGLYEVHSLSWRPSGVDQWYFWAAVVDGTNKTLRVLIFGVTENAWVVDFTATPTNQLFLGTQPLYIGGSYPYICGNVDMMAVFDWLLSDDEIYNIHQGTFGRITAHSLTHCRPAAFPRVAGISLTHSRAITEPPRVAGRSLTHCRPVRLDQGGLFMVF